jgi:hypothetical protein
MEEIRTKIEELKTMQQTPESYLYSHFDALKFEVVLR